MPRAQRHYLPGYIWHITHRCHKKEFLSGKTSAALVQPVMFKGELEMYDERPDAVFRSIIVRRKTAVLQVTNQAVPLL